jgi:hypothetical protein
LKNPSQRRGKVTEEDLIIRGILSEIDVVLRDSEGKISILEVETIEGLEKIEEEEETI